MKKLQDHLPCSVTYNEIIYENYMGPSEKSLNVISRLPPNAKYFLECIYSLGSVGHFLMDYYLFKKDDIKLLQEFGRKNQWNLVNEYFRTMFIFLKKDISLASLNFNPNDFPEKQNLDGHVSIKNIIITPTKILKEDEEETSNNRAFRRLGTENISQIKFRDEDGSWFPRDQTLLKTKMYDRLINGLTISGRIYHDFGCSSSLFRESGTYFYQAWHQENIVDIINEWAIFKKEPAAKVSARVGLYFSSATEINMKLRNNEIGQLDDIVSPPPRHDHDPPQYTFSDGIGIIDIAFAREIQKQLDLDQLPSAFQFRCLGYKGMVAIDPYNKNLVSNGGQYVVMFRDSQKKFESIRENEIDFEVIKYSSPAPLKLHRSFIALLVALARDQGKLYVVEKRLHELFSSAFLEIIESLFDEKAFTKVLNRLPKHFPMDKLYPEELIQQEFLRTVVEANAVNLGKQLNNKCQIPLPETLGRSCLGVMDETGLLGPNQVYIQYTNDIRSKSPNPLTTVRCGLVGVTKSPMYHMGDIRYLEAVNIPKLKHHIDVIVFSQHGHRPIPDQIGGGDLDGDCYSVFWDPIFLLDHSEPAHFPSPDSSELSKVSINELHHSHAEFRMKYMELNNLQQISNLHTCHITLHHPEHQEVKNLAEKADVAVNSFKSGIFSKPILPAEKPVFFPSFMNKRHEPMFDSDHVLDEIHQRCKRMYLMLQITHNEKSKQRASKEKKFVETSPFSKDLYEKYCNELNLLKIKYNIQTEAELFAGVTLDPPGSFNSFKCANKNEEETSSLVQEALRMIIGKFRTLILDKFHGSWRNDMHQKKQNLTTYVLPSYEVPQEMKALWKEFYDLANNESIFLSFPYLVIEGYYPTFSTFVDRSVTYEINKIISDFIKTSYDGKNQDEQDKSMAIEANLIQLSFSPVKSTYNEPFLHEMILSYPPFVISIPDYWSGDFSLNYDILKDASGCVDVAVRLRKNKGRFHYFTVACEGNLKSCLTLEHLLTPYLKYDHSISFSEMKQHKTKVMQNLLEKLFGFIPPSEPNESLHHSNSAPGRFITRKRDQFHCEAPRFGFMSHRKG